MLGKIIFQQLAELFFSFLEIRLIDPERVVGIEGDDFDVHGAKITGGPAKE